MSRCEKVECSNCRFNSTENIIAGFSFAAIDPLAISTLVPSEARELGLKKEFLHFFETKNSRFARMDLWPVKWCMAV